MVEIHHQLVTPPATIRERYRTMGREKRITVLAWIQIRPDREPVGRAIMLALKTLAQRCVAA